MERSRQAAQSADLVLAVVDAAAFTEEDREILRLAARCPHWILVLNKDDLVPGHAQAVSIPADLPRPAAAVWVSALNGTGLEDLADAVAALFPEGDVPDGSVLTNARQQESALRARRAISRAAEALESGMTPDVVLTDAEEALSALGELTGRTAGEEIVSRIFQRFCVGK